MTTTAITTTSTKLLFLMGEKNRREI